MGHYHRILCLAFDTIKLLFGTGTFSEWLGSVLLRYGRYKYRPLPSTVKDGAETDPNIPQRATIRILRVEHAEENRGIKCSLTTLQGLQSQEYHCLSYTWGDAFGPDVDYIIQSRSYIATLLAPVSSALSRYCRKFKLFFQPKHYIINIDDGFLSITPNLRSAIIHLHKTRPEFQAIWIDAICINQDDEDEKSAQVPIMHNIYGHAKSVIAWVGPEDKRNENPKLVSEVIDALHMQDKAREGFCGQMLTWTWNESFEEFPAPEHIQNLGFEHWFAVRNFLQRPYFQRMWIFQELIVAKEIVITCGKHILDWNDVRNISQAFSTFGCDIMTRYSRAGFWAAESNSPHRVAFWRDQYQSKPTERLRRQFGPFVLTLNRNDFQCSNGRDMLYAHMGVCNYDRIVPDYKKPLGQVYMEFWADVLERVPTSINFLTCVEDASCSVNRSRYTAYSGDLIQEDQKSRKILLPSWVPDFQARLEPGSLTQHYYTNCFFASCELEEIPLSINHAENCLILHGFLFDTVARISESGQELRQDNSIMGIAILMEELCTYHGIAYPTNEHPFEAVWKTMAILTDIAGEKDTDYPPPLSTRQTFADWLLYIIASPRVLTGKRNENQKALEHILSTNVDSTDLVPSLEAVKLAAEALRLYLLAKVHRKGSHGTLLAGRKSGDDLQLTFQPTGEGHVGLAASSFGDRALNRMRLFRTKEGHFIGKGPQSVEVGDEICIIPGAQVPFILRKIPGIEKWRFVGQTYVHGIMHGEVSGRFQGCKHQQFVIE